MAIISVQSWPTFSYSFKTYLYNAHTVQLISMLVHEVQVCVKTYRLSTIALGS